MAIYQVPIFLRLTLNLTAIPKSILAGEEEKQASKKHRIGRGSWIWYLKM